MRIRIQRSHATVKDLYRRLQYAYESFSGRLFYQGIEGRFTSESSQAFLTMIMVQTTGSLLLIRDGARYHTSKATEQFFARACHSPHGTSLAVVSE
jgi:hypothetical protein